MKNKFNQIIETLKAYKELTRNVDNHEELLKDKTILLQTAILLENADNAIVALSLDIFEDFIYNDKSHATLLSTFGIFEALESLSIKLRSSNENLAKRASDLVGILRNSAPPAYSTRSRTKNNRTLRKCSWMYLLYIEHLNTENRNEIEEALLQIKGIISFVIDLEFRRCTIRIGPKLTIINVVSKLCFVHGIKALLVIKNREKMEEYLDILDTKLNEYPEYFMEDTTPPKGKSVAKNYNLIKDANGFMKKITDFWNNSFYW